MNTKTFFTNTVKLSLSSRHSFEVGSPVFLCVKFIQFSPCTQGGKFKMYFLEYLTN